MSAKKVSAAAKNSSLLPKLSKAPLIVSQDLQEIPQPGRSTCTCNFIVWACDKNLKSVNFRTYIAYTTFTRGLDRCVTVTKRVRSFSTKAKIISTTRENLMDSFFLIANHLLNWFGSWNEPTEILTFELTLTLFHLHGHRVQKPDYIDCSYRCICWEKPGIFPINPPKNTPISKKRVLIEHLKEKLEPRR